MAKRRIVVKIGSSSLTNNSGTLNEKKLTDHVEALVKLKQAGHEVVLISSGAVAAGFTRLGYPGRPVAISAKQAAASVGQSLLMQVYMEQFAQYACVAAQLLLTKDDFADKERFANVQQTMTELLKRGAIPIINENDATSVEELTFGDNDMLSALISGFLHADLLCMLTDINGLYDNNPFKDAAAKKYDYLPGIDAALMAGASDSGSRVGTGGMKSKLLAAKTANDLGVNTFIGTGSGANKLLDIIDGNGDGTYIGPFSEGTGMSATKQWISLHSKVRGSITVDAGAERALLKRGKSLLPAGVLSVHGIFTAGDVIEVLTQENVLIGKGRTQFSSEEVDRVKGLESRTAMRETNSKKAEIIHRDFWVRHLKGEVRQ
ncbi:glutamate 5-kinase [Shouchella shacheensis]|uniref:glutamate 5-kinase n=1 Tax=Shouchella shacheensis TaxID=1649580 RepID=UPI00074040FE|nr:glutamate 5-kinase [Shouchella shacheensis]